MRDTIKKTFEKKEIFLLLHVVLYALSVIYGAAVRIRLLFYRLGILKIKKLPCKIISIGNITVGGSGKTPLAIHVAKTLKEKGIKIVILSRGYKRKTKGIKVVSNGSEILSTIEEAGDEPYLIAKKTRGIPVIVGEDRIKSGMYAIKNFSPNVIILDDGFQHIRLKRDANIVLIDGDKWFGSGYMLPRGPLREPLGGIKRADVILVKNGTCEPAREFKKPCFRFTYKKSSLLDINGKRIDIGFLKNKNVLILTGIASPESFIEDIKTLGATIKKTLIYPDHHWYTQKDMDEIKKSAAGLDVIITTEKDGVKLASYPLGGVEIIMLEIDVEIQEAARFLSFISEKADIA